MYIHNWIYLPLVEGWSKNEQLQDILMNICYTILHFGRAHTCVVPCEASCEAPARHLWVTGSPGDLGAINSSLLQLLFTPTPEFTPEFTPTPALLQLQLQHYFNSNSRVYSSITPTPTPTPEFTPESLRLTYLRLTYLRLTYLRLDIFTAGHIYS